ncbi:MAG: DUF1292 domain-containing protein [Candidatus Cloacimonadaceae bacterium]|jgi:hypothetical protein|nr:DUF1292 domain-containing protein [Candidatus Cloacimonadota bacterium]MDY0128042.1 DUF1292 domain-containing protein [Candidatus Cloacimonadaceae bacterium]MCB5255023.1 DUF1292 domain-containing protein [Candidatus Cloacimonadota bacterium]MCK9178026.1 DUF1292 domain-containing protein [Candidatus Cloacimonadota bacterium]MCK9241882.1 DUF1292 domain-containing protein [Candidatus Cloacimonadota bacterium]
MVEKKDTPNSDEKDIEENGEDLSRVITLEMEDGSEKDFIVLDILSHDDNNYIALSEEDSMEYDVLRFVEADEFLELSIIEDEDEYDMITNLFKEKFEEMLNAELDFDFGDLDYEEEEDDEEEEDEKGDEV